MTFHFGSNLKNPSKSDYLEVMSQVASTVSVIASNGPAGLAGLTVSSLTSVSADCANPVILVCINKSSRAGSVIVKNGAFSANILHEGQTAIADMFSGRTDKQGRDRFDQDNWSFAPQDAPALDGALAILRCVIRSSVRVGSHQVIFGAVEQIDFGSRSSPLIYLNRGYGSVSEFVNKPQQAMAVDDRIGNDR